MRLMAQDPTLLESTYVFKFKCKHSFKKKIDIYNHTVLAQRLSSGSLLDSGSATWPPLLEV